jgi:hypothetical protein
MLAIDRPNGARGCAGKCGKLQVFAGDFGDRGPAEKQKRLKKGSDPFLCHFCEVCGRWMSQLMHFRKSRMGKIHKPGDGGAERVLTRRARMWFNGRCYFSHFRVIAHRGEMI